MAMQWKATQPAGSLLTPQAMVSPPTMTASQEHAAEVIVPPVFAPVEGDTEPPAFQDLPAAAHTDR
jgi:hypothetical protein